MIYKLRTGVGPLTPRLNESPVCARREVALRYRAWLDELVAGIEVLLVSDKGRPRASNGYITNCHAICPYS